MAEVAPSLRDAVAPLPADMVAAMTGRSWRPGCPVGPAQLRLVRVDYWGFDNAAHRGELVVHADVAEAMVHIFATLYRARFPIRRMVPVEAYGADDNASMADDNTSAFNCRRVQGTTTWSRHAYGKAIDINPVENPYLRGGAVLPPAGAAYLDRRVPRSGLVVDGDVVTRAFAAEGFRWGGRFEPSPDYQHFDVAP
jgi:D-alanyl-D-alanine carboxypeptidase